ncbi:hypothetical protein [Kutzneria sp. NPDC051319]|uniref:hypothetical protein n=1 Tax=Kutzneria sp. NPDC051319 TaxID=3155047 RepID=UPI0034177B4F
MSVSTALVRLYPPAIRERWGSAIAEEVGRAGPRSWVNSAIGAGRLWLHPGDWPETAEGETSRVVATALVAVSVVLTLWLRAAGVGSLSATVDRPASSAWLVPILAGFALATPLPRRSGLGRLVKIMIRTLAAPALLFGFLCLLANLGVFDHPAGVTHVLLVGCYWATLFFGGIRICVLVARAGRVVVMPSAYRLHIALLLVATGLAFAAAQSLAVALRTSFDLGSVMLICALATSAAALLVTGLDLRRRRP